MIPAMKIGVTGNVACGKSTATKMLADTLGARTFFSDLAVHQLLEEDETVRNAVATEFPLAIVDGFVSRKLLRDLVFADADARDRLERILHPAVRALWTESASESLANGICFLAEIPLLFEVGVESHFHVVVAILSSPSTQIQRLAEGRGLSPEVARRIMSAQMTTSEKAEKADVVIWNDGSISALADQVALLSRQILEGKYCVEGN